MAEIKRNFTTARMNKDLDERLIGNGEYRDAMNIQIRTTDGDAAGTVQNIKGTTNIGTSPTSTPLLSLTDSDGDAQNKAIGSIVDNRTNKSYFLFAAPELQVDFTAASSDGVIGNDITGPIYYIDSIAEIGDNFFNKTIINDYYAVVATRANYSITATANTNTINTTANVQYVFRPGQIIQLYASDGTALLTANTKIVTSVSSAITINKEVPTTIDASTCSFIQVVGERVLNFNQKNRITAINIVDDFLFFTDGISEPKKVNIRRCRDGSPKEFDSTLPLSLLDYTHTHLSLDHQVTGVPISVSQYSSAASIDGSEDLKEEHITVIRKAPRTAPNIVMSKSPRGNNVDFNIVTTSLIDFIQADSVLISNTVAGNEDFNPLNYSITEGDVLILKSSNNQTNTPAIIRARIESITENSMELQVLSNTNVLATDLNWHCTLEQDKPFFELKFPRFGYRFKYNDGEYSSFSPFSEIAFLPGKYDYIAKKGFNLGMTNNLRELKITNFLPEESMRPDDIETVDILYKSTDSPVVYVIKSINRDIDPEWNGSESVTANEVLITSDMVYKALPNNQILRSYDNVPRFALAQEIIGNRLVYANYTQGFNINFTPGIETTLQEKNLEEILNPEKSIKSLRTYKIGTVYGDKYGRETPVMSSGERVIKKLGAGAVSLVSGDTAKNTRIITDSVTLNKKEAVKSSKIKVKQHWEVDDKAYSIPDWLDYVKFYVKETSSEYYNMLQHRWYNAEDGNIWIAFGSADRNKIDEESYLILKKKHGDDVFVEEEARYKVLDISNEAPDFIKTKATRLGVVTVPASVSEDYDDSNDTEGLSLVNRFEIDGNIPIGTEFEDKDIFVRIKGNSRRSDGSEKNVIFTGYKRVISKSNEDQAEDNFFEVEFAFGNEARFINYFVSIGDYDNDGTGSNGARNANTGVQYQYEFRALSVENKPEFDGRFFVKIFKDAVLEKYVLGSEIGSANFMLNTTKSFNVGYLDNNTKINPGINGPFKDYVFGTNTDSDKPYESWVLEQYANGNINNGFLPDPATNFVSFVAVGDHDITSGLNNNSSGTSYSGFGKYGASRMYQTMVYWQRWRNHNARSIFIDAGDAFAVETSFGTGDFRTFQDEDISALTNIFQAVNPGAFQDFSDEQLGAAGVFACDGSKRGFAKSGTAANDTIDRIFFGITPTNLNTDSDFWTNKHDDAPEGFIENNGASFWGDSNATGIQVDFYDTMTQPGTLFRFKEDPTSVYRILGDEDVEGVSDSVKTSGMILNYYRFNGETNNSQSSFFTTTFGAALPEQAGFNQPGLTGGTTGVAIQSGNNPFRQNFYCTFRRVDLDTGENTNEGIDISSFDPRGNVRHDGQGALEIEILEPLEILLENDTTSSKGAVWETEPKENVDLDVYYEASSALPMVLNEKNTVDFAPIGSIVTIFEADGVTEKTLFGGNSIAAIAADTSLTLANLPTKPLKVKRCYDSIVKIVGSGDDENLVKNGINIGDVIKFTHADGTVTTSTITKFVDADVENIGLIKEVTLDNNEGYYEIDKNVYQKPVVIPWSNCFTFGNGVESNRIRDDFNAPFINNGVNVSTTFLNYKEENITNGFIFSGIYNSNSSVNNFNEFNMSDNITKEINPTYGEIQRLKARDTDLITFAEDKVLKVLANKDALFNADGNANLTASNKVLGQVVPYVGDYGISKDPASLAVDQFRMYFTDKQRGAVLRLSRDGITPISNIGMRNYFRDNLSKCDDILGSYDTVSGEYNLTLKFQPVFQQSDVTVSFNEASKGWISFKSFIPDTALSMNSNYFSTSDNTVHKHHTGTRNTFYGSFTKSHIDFIFNQAPGTIKNFKTINYEGSQGHQININNVSAPTFDNAGSLSTVTGYTDTRFSLVSASDNVNGGVNTIKGWKVSSIKTDLQEGEVIDFSKKEGKWYGNIVGSFDVSDVTFNDVTITSDPSELSTQGLGVPTSISYSGVSVNHNLIIDGDG